MIYSQREIQKELKRRAQEELIKRRVDDPEGYKLEVQKALRAELFEQQVKVLDDPSRRISLCCSRRAGKSELAARMIAMSLISSQRNEFTLFSARTMTRAKQIIWDPLSRINDQYQLGWRMQAHIGEVKTPDGAMFMLLGVDDAIAAEKVRGSKYRLAICDEASTYEEHLDVLITDCISPGCLDFDPPGKIVIAGTPGRVRKGYWFDVACGNKPAYSNHHWTLRQNPHIKNAEVTLAEERLANGWTENDPVYLREYEGIWAADETSLVYAYQPGRNDVWRLPEPPEGMSSDQWIREQWLTTVAADIGYKDDFSVVCLGSPPHSTDIYVLHAEREGNMLVGAQAERIKGVRDKYKPNRTAIDAGGMGKLTFEEYTQRYGKLQGGRTIRAEKHNKIDAIGLMNSDLRSGTLKVLQPQCKSLTEEWRTLPWQDEDREKEHRGFANHTCFVAGTLVHTSRGEIPIEEMKTGMLVATRAGWKPVAASFSAGRRQTYRLESEAGTLVGTYDHPIWTARGWRQLGSLQAGEELLWLKSANMASQFTPSGTASSIDDIQNRTIEQAVCTGIAASLVVGCYSCIATSGSCTMGQFRPTTTSTISTKTHSTTSRRTWNVGPGLNIYRSICELLNGSSRADVTYCSTPSRLRKLGTLVQKAWSSIVALAPWRSRTSKAQTASANAAERSSSRVAVQQTSVETNASQSCAGSPVWMTKCDSAAFVQSTSKPINTANSGSVVARVIRVTPTGSTEEVYNLAVAECPEYFANGVLVHNCDAALYAWRAHKAFLAQPAPNAKTPEEIERERDEQRNQRVRASLKKRR